MIILLRTYSCYGPFLTNVIKVNNSVPAELFTGKDNGSYSSPTPAPNDGLPKWQCTATQYLLDAAAHPARSAEMVTSWCCDLYDDNGR